LAGPGGSLEFWWAPDGTSTWHPEQVDGRGSSVAAPAITDDGGTVYLAATPLSGDTGLYIAGHGSSTWHKSWMAVPAPCNAAAPAITMVTNSTYGTFAETASTYGC